MILNWAYIIILADPNEKMNDIIDSIPKTLADNSGLFDKALFIIANNFDKISKTLYEEFH